MGIIDSITGTVTSVVGWFFQVMPPALRIFFFMFFIVFLVGFITSVTLGAFYSCDSVGVAYKMSSYSLSLKEDFMSLGVDKCQQVQGYMNSPTNVTQTWWLFQPLSQAWSSIKNLLWSGGGGGVNAACNVLVNTSQLLGQNWRDVYLHSADPVLPKQGFSVGCIKDAEDKTQKTYNPSLKYYGVNVLDPTLWLFGSLMTLLVPFAFWWYRTIIR